MTDLVLIKNAIADLEEDLVLAKIKEFIDGSPNGKETQQVVAACQEGMEIVGIRYSEGKYYVGDLIFAGDILTNCIEMLKPLLGKERQPLFATIVLGTVKGDVHDIGKSIFKIIAEAEGFNVIDLGIDLSPEIFVEAVEKYKPQVVGFSGILTITVDAMKDTIKALEKAGLRKTIKIIIGGNVVNNEICEYIGADAWSKDASKAVKMCVDWVDTMKTS